MRPFNEGLLKQLEHVTLAALTFVDTIAISAQPHVVVSTLWFHVVTLTIAEYLCVPQVLQENRRPLKSVVD